MPSVSASMAGGNRGQPEKLLGFITYRQATFVASVFSMVFSLMIFAHEMALEGVFDLRNYVVVAFCFIWLIVTSLLVLGTYKVRLRAHFLLLPWLILTSMLTPLFVIGIVAGCKMIGSCIKDQVVKACKHEYHLFGTKDHVEAGMKLAFLFIILIANSGSILVVYKYFSILTSADNRKRAQPGDNTLMASEDGHVSGVHYERFQDDLDPETNVPLCESLDEGKEVTT